VDPYKTHRRRRLRRATAARCPPYLRQTSAGRSANFAVLRRRTSGVVWKCPTNSCGAG